MSKFRVEWTREQWFYVEIEADSPEQAKEKFWEGDYENEQMFGSEIQDGVEAHEVDNA
jgi:hypothetical protein